jgi:hypothetical protein
MNEQPTDIFRSWRVEAAIIGSLVLLSIFLLAKVGSEIANYRYIGAGVHATNTITVEGEGKVTAVPNIARVTFTSSARAATVAAAQEEAANISNAALAFLKEAGIEDKDIKTESYATYPEYTYDARPCAGGYCPPGEQRITGYNVSQSVSVKLRDLENVGEILTGLGSARVSNISGPNFDVEDREALLRDARKQAIEQAKEKANMLAKDLGVQTVRVVSFWESGAGMPYYAYDTKSLGMGGEVAQSAPTLPVGENEIVTRVSITYEIR